MNSIVNIAAYKFAVLQNLSDLRAEFQTLTKAQRLRGTILLSPEGINLFVAGLRDGIDTLLARLRDIPEIADIPVKESFSDELPFNRMLVKIKPEIIAFGVPGIEPARYTSRRLSARELKRWLDEGRPVTLLDTRNDFEVQTGTFKNAVAIGVEDFRDFPSAVSRLPDQWKQQPIVTFCTGGIRCEKATPYLEREGFRDVYQLDGGILKYFEECGDAHYQGDCFVFDKRVALNASLKQSTLQQCFACQSVLSPEDIASPKYVAGQSCPHCYQTEAEARARLIQSRQQAIRKATSPLPGSVPYDNVRPLSVPLRLDGLEVLDALEALHTRLSREEWRQVCAEGNLVCRGDTVRPGRTVRAGERLQHKLPATREPDVATGIEILHEDDAIVVIHKPAPLPMHPCGRFNRNSLSYILDKVYRPLKLRPIHRLDADTSGVVIFAKHRDAARLLSVQFETGGVKKLYLARVLGRPIQHAFECHSPISIAPGPTGAARLPDENGAPASTRFRVLKEFDDGTTLLEVEPLTGRTNQIRAHLWQLLMPIQGDPIYLPNQQLEAAARSLTPEEPPLCLHASAIEFTHPATRERVRYKTSDPAWATDPGERGASAQR